MEIGLGTLLCITVFAPRLPYLIPWRTIYAVRFGRWQGTSQGLDLLHVTDLLVSGKLIAEFLGGIPHASKIKLPCLHRADNSHTRGQRESALFMDDRVGASVMSLNWNSIFLKRIRAQTILFRSFSSVQTGVLVHTFIRQTAWIRLAAWMARDVSSATSLSR